MTFTITEGTEIPAPAARAKTPNPFEGRFPTPEGKTLVVVLPSGTEDERKAVEKVVTLAQQAGRAVDTTTRHLREETAGKSPSTKITFWSVPKIVRPRKVKVSESIPPTE